MKYSTVILRLRASRWWVLAARLLLLKVVFGIVLLGTLLSWDEFDNANFGRHAIRWPRSGNPTFGSHFGTWDAAHYLLLSEVGYEAGAPSCAFYPLWPLLVRFLSHIAGASHLVTGVVAANIISLGAWVFFHALVKRQWGEPAANWSLAFLIAFPGSLFFQFNYTESVFLLLVLFLWWGLDERRFRVAWLAGCLLPITRAIGVFAVLPIAWNLAAKASVPPAKNAPASGGPEPTTLVTTSQRSLHSSTDILAAVAAELEVGSATKVKIGRNLFRPQGWVREWATNLLRQPLWLLAAPITGWGVYLTLMGLWTGDAFEGFKAQRYWGVRSISNLWNIPKFVTDLLTPTTWHDYAGSLLDRCAFVLILYCLPKLWQLDKGLIIWTYVLGVIPVMSGTFTSNTRYASCDFPVFIALGVIFAHQGRRWAGTGLLLVFGLLHLVLVWRFVNFRWAG